LKKKLLVKLNFFFFRNTFNNNKQGALFIDSPDGQLDVSNNVFANTVCAAGAYRIVDAYITDTSRVSFTDNIIANNTCAITFKWDGTSTTSGQQLILRNNIYNNTNTDASNNATFVLSGYIPVVRENFFENPNNKYEMSTSTQASTYYTTQYNATNNWWGTSNERSIRNKIYDYFENLNLMSIIYFPYLASANLNDVVPNNAPRVPFEENSVIGGVLAGSTVRLTLAGSPYTVRENVFLTANATMIIDAGTFLYDCVSERIGC
jgi:hypothetical protein